MKTGIIYLIGRAGTGKYTIAKELSKSAGYIICDNHLVNYPILTLLNYDGTMDVPGFVWGSIAKVREGIFDFLRNEIGSNYILTNVLSDYPRDHTLFSQIEKVAEDRGSFFAPIKLLISEEENRKRIQNPDRLLRQKSIDVIHTTSDNILINISHPNLLELDVTNLPASEAAQRILEHSSTIN